MEIAGVANSIINVYAWASLSASVVSLILGIIVFSLNRKNLLNKVFLVTSASGFYWTFTEFMMWQSNTADVANFWSKMGFLWPFFVVLFLHFSLLYTQNRLLKNKLFYLLLYVPAIVFAIVDLSTELINSQPILEYWGYEDGAPLTWMYGVSLVWVAVLPITALIASLRFHLVTKDRNKKRQSKYITLAFSIPILAYLITNVIFPTFSISIPNLGHFATLFFAILVSYAILKHELFTFDAALAAENIVSIMPDSIFLADIKGKILKMNKSLTDFVGYSQNELVGETFGKLFVETNLSPIILSELHKARIIRNRELTVKTKKGEIKTVLFSGSVVRSKTRRDLGFACTLRDITDRKSMEERLVKTERLASIGELAGQIGHDLRNPLHAIKMGIYFLQKKGDEITRARRDEMMSTINNAIDDSNRIINSLVDYSRELHIKREKCTPQSLLTRALSKSAIPDRIKVIDMMDCAPEMNWDVQEMETTFVSLLKNAIEAIPKEGTIEIHCKKYGDYIDLSVTDSGTGIPTEVLPKVFSPLVTSKAKGMGMGLAISKRIVEAHDGRIFFDSIPGKGTTFTIRLPTSEKLQSATIL